MKRFYYDCWVAKFLLGASSCHTITIGPFVFSKRKEEYLNQAVRNHETCHSYQWIEAAAVSGFIILLLQLICGISAWWMLLSGAAYYIWYGLEYAVRFIMYRDINKAYRGISFEHEAYSSEHDCNYIENRRLFTSWTTHLFR